ncbi:hypothetical protein HKCCE2091_17320 [Rhodobacterales bacterium HKCCE2091]|nr:hypothetical protein [Rhodobacterales bacterium HKCCE2091]
MTEALQIWRRSNGDPFAGQTALTGDTCVCGGLGVAAFAVVAIPGGITLWAWIISALAGIV